MDSMDPVMYICRNHGAASADAVLGFPDGKPGAGGDLRSRAWGSGRKGRIPLFSKLSDTEGLCPPAAGFSGIFYRVLEFHAADDGRAGRAAFDRGSGGMGICEIPVPREKNALKLGILPFKVIADLIGLYFIAFKNGANGSMGNTLQFGVSRFCAAGLDEIGRAHV